MIEDGEGEVVVPPSVQALLAARLDQLDGDERSVLERGAVEGQVFHRGAVQALGVTEVDVSPRLAALIRKELVRPEAATFSGDGRVPLPPHPDPGRHLRRAAEGDPRAAARALRALARAARCGPGRAGRDPRLPPGASPIGTAPSSDLSTTREDRSQSGPRRGSPRAPATPETRGDMLLPVACSAGRRPASGKRQPARLDLELERARALFDAGQLKEVEELVSAVGRAAAALGDERLTALARVEEMILAGHVGQQSTFEPAAFDEPTAVLERVGDEIGLAHALAYRGRVEFFTGKRDAGDRLLRTCCRAQPPHGLRREARDFQQWTLAAMYYGPPGSRRFSPMRNNWHSKTSRSGRRPLRPKLIIAAVVAMEGNIERAQ